MSAAARAPSPSSCAGACPGLTATVFDLPHVAGFAARKIVAAGLSGRITTAAGDLFAPGPYPAGHDTTSRSV
jgi:3-hydroxy-5-methyl-1-naphthoate 3-O-methyltransferase